MEIIQSTSQETSRSGIQMDSVDVNKPVPVTPVVPSSPNAIQGFVHDNDKNEEYHAKTNEILVDVSEPSNQMYQKTPDEYWGVVESLPLELSEISPPPISPSRLFVSSLTPLVEEASLESNGVDVADDESSSNADTWSVSNNFGNSEELSAIRDWETPKRMVDCGVQTSFTNMTFTSPMPASTTPTELDWDQFVLVEHLEDTPVLAEPEAELSPPSRAPPPPSPIDPLLESLEERLQKKMKNWPRYIQNLMET